MSEVEVLRGLLERVLVVFKYEKLNIKNNNDAQDASRLRREIEAALRSK